MLKICTKYVISEFHRDLKTVLKMPCFQVKINEINLTENTDLNTSHLFLVQS